jgi:hypothetical protein
MRIISAGCSTGDAKERLPLNDPALVGRRQRAAAQPHERQRTPKWRQNKLKIQACGVEARKKGLAGDDRWSILESCMVVTEFPEPLLSCACEGPIMSAR